MKKVDTELLMYDISQIKMSKQLHIQQALEANLKEKKQEILSLERQCTSRIQAQEANLLKLSHLKNQRQFYQNQFQVA